MSLRKMQENFILALNSHMPKCIDLCLLSCMMWGLPDPEARLESGWKLGGGESACSRSHLPKRITFVIQEQSVITFAEKLVKVAPYLLSPHFVGTNVYTGESHLS